MKLDLLSEDWAAAVHKLVENWPDDAEKADARKPDTYWAYVERKRNAFHDTFAFTVRGVPGVADGSFVALTFGEAGVCTSVRIVDAAEAASAKLAMECGYENWLEIVGGYDIGKAMTYHKLPLVHGASTDMLRFAYFVHELLVVMSRVETEQTAKASV